MHNFLEQAKINVLYASSAAFAGSTGDAGGTTAGTTNFGGSTAGGYPYSSTGIDMAGFANAMFVATIAGATAAILKVGFSTVGSTVGVTGWTDLPFAGAGVGTTSPSTAFTYAAVDVYNVQPRYLAGIVQVPSSSAIVNSITAYRYNPTVEPTSQPTNTAGFNTAAGSTS